MHRRRARRDHPGCARFYAGHRGDRAQVYVVTRQGLRPLAPERSCGPAYDWGADTPGALALARALLADLCGRRAPAAVESAFAAGPIAGLPHDGFVLDARDLQRWLARTRPVAPSPWAPLWPGCPPLWPTAELPARHHPHER